MTRRFDLLCLDLDGTLVDSLRDIQCALVAAFAVVPADDPEEARTEQWFVERAGFGRSLQEIFAQSRPRRDEPTTRRFVEAYVAFYREHGLVHTRPFPGVAETLAELQPLRRQGLRIAVATTKRTETATRVLAGLELDRFFDAIVGSEALPPKPAPDVLLRCAELTERPAARGLMVGDMPGDLQAGQAAGMKTCAVSTGILPRSELERYAPDWFLERFEDLVRIVTG